MENTSFPILPFGFITKDLGMGLCWPGLIWLQFLGHQMMCCNHLVNNKKQNNQFFYLALPNCMFMINCYVPAHEGKGSKTWIHRSSNWRPVIGGSRQVPLQSWSYRAPKHRAMVAMPPKWGPFWAGRQHIWIWMHRKILQVKVIHRRVGGSCDII